MISREQIQKLIDRRPDGSRVLSAFLDMSVDSNNKRHHQVFLNQEKAQFSELDSDRPGHHHEAIGATFDRIEQWLGTEYDESKKGVAIYTTLDGDWFEAHQLSVPLPNRLSFGDRPVVSPLVEILERYHHHGVVLVDREHLRLLSIFLDQALNERAVETEPHPASHDIRRGGFSAKDYQARKEEETRHFFKEFAEEVGTFVRRYRPDDLILLGTHENVTRFREFLSSSTREMIVHTDRMEPDASTSEIRNKLAPFFEVQLAEEEARAVDHFRERVRESHLAVSGPGPTLEQLQEGKLRTLLIARGLHSSGGRCGKCGFVLDRSTGECPYCGGHVEDGIDLGEEMVRMAQDQGIDIEFVERSTLEDYRGVGGLLRF